MDFAAIPAILNPCAAVECLGPRRILFPCFKFSSPSQTMFTRRSVLRTLSATAPFFAVPGLLAEELTRTPPQMEGPFYPDKLPLDTDNDLLVINDKLTPAVGEITYLSGRILDAGGKPLRGATVEIWQCDSQGSYLHSKGSPHGKRDGNYQGFGRFVTGSTGEYLFRTIKPVPYPGRTPHIHVLVKKGDRTLLTTQCYIQGHAANEKDGIYLRAVAGNPKNAAALLVDFAPIPGSKLGELAAKFDVVLGATPADG
jgi:protocatechuate 3,4-dioxygenase beta subunit